MQQRHGSVIGPLILITIGALFLLANLGYVSGAFWLSLIQFWPLILILAGLEIFFGRTRLGQIVVLLVGLLAIAGVVWLAINPNVLARGGMNVETVSEARANIQQANVELNPGVGELIVAPLDAASANWVEGTISFPNTMRVEKTYQVENGAAQLKLDTEGTVLLFGTPAQRWNILFSPHVPIALKVDAGVGGSDLDLNGLNITALDLDTGIGGMEVIMPSRAGTVNARVNGGIGGLTIWIPQGVPARIRTRTGIGGATVNQARFPRVGDNLYESPDYASAPNKIDLNVDAGIGGITIP